jgi:hypothetical protein
MAALGPTGLPEDWEAALTSKKKTHRRTPGVSARAMLTHPRRDHRAAIAASRVAS